MTKQIKKSDGFIKGQFELPNGDKIQFRVSDVRRLSPIFDIVHHNIAEIAIRIQGPVKWVKKNNNIRKAKRTKRKI